jgi:hypothetical protein
MPQASQAITSQGCLAVIAASTVGQNHTAPLAERTALNCPDDK